MANAINWFEIPAADFDRAKKFYSEILASELPVDNINGFQMAMLPATRDGVGGAVCSGEGMSPSDKGTVPYLNGGENLQGILSRVEKAGGKIVIPKTKISDEIGYFAQFIDSEGNRVALHSQN